MDSPSTLPPLAPLQEEGRLPVSGGHELHYQVSGTHDGVPALYLHGGPGGRLTSGYRRKVPGETTRLVGFSQRGAGASTPSASEPAGLEHNTTAELGEDIEALRIHLGIEDWVVQGVSWGASLAVAYAQAHPERVRAVVLMAVTATTRTEVDWITEHVGTIFPETWQELAALAEARTDYRPGGEMRLVEAYRQMLTSGERDLEDAATRAWIAWEDEHIRIGTGGLERVTADPGAPVEDQARVFARLVTHYWARDGFLADWATGWGGEPGSGLLGGMHRIGHIPAVLIHGRRDVSGPVRIAWQMHRAWPASELIVVEDEGHGGEAMVAAWAQAMARFTAR